VSPCASYTHRHSAAAVVDDHREIGLGCLLAAPALGGAHVTGALANGRVAAAAAAIAWSAAAFDRYAPSVRGDRRPTR